MKFINCRTLQTEEYFGSQIPKAYAILSHRWEKDEAVYQDFEKPPEATAQKAGWIKVRKFCSLALEEGYEYAWVDTCCIDKQNLVELSEAINSMFRWYAEATVCYTYLSDVLSAGEGIAKSLWFTRGWTLQELIAPPRMKFFDKHWNPIGTRTELRAEIQARTTIDRDLLDESDSSDRKVVARLSKIPLACRMSWAQGRITTRDEDRAYSLLGIFNVNMPMLYGEGERAFIRLQEAIIKESNDMSLFAWTALPPEALGSQGSKFVAEPGYCGILAPSPDMFVFPHGVVHVGQTSQNREFTLTNKGLRITSEVFKAKHHWIVPLWCGPVDGDGIYQYVLILEELGVGEFVRWRDDVSSGTDKKVFQEIRTFYVKTLIDSELQLKLSLSVQISSAPRRSFRFHDKEHKLNRQPVHIIPQRLWSDAQQSFITEGLDDFMGYVMLRTKYVNTTPFAVVCGFSQGVDMWAYLASETGKYRQLFSIITTADSEELRRMAIKTKQASRSVVTTPVSGSARVSMYKSRREENGEHIVDIYIDVTFDCFQL